MSARQTNSAPHYGPGLPPLNTQFNVPARKPIPSYLVQLPQYPPPLTPEKQRFIEARMRLAFGPQNGVATNPRPTVHQVAQSVTEIATITQNIEFAFKAYQERKMDDFQNLQTLCSMLVTYENLEKEHWKLLCKKALQERDAARAIIARNAAAGQPFYYRSAAAAPTRERTRSVSPLSRHSTGPTRSARSLPHSRSASPTSPVDYPAHSSPQHQQCSPVDLETGTPPPLSGSTSGSNDSDTLPEAENVPRTPVRSAPSPANMLGGFFPTEQGDSNPRRRRSCDSTHSANSAGTLVDGLLFAGPISRPTAAPLLPSDLAHVDLMYLKMGDHLVCRVCKLAAERNPQHHSLAEPTKYPLEASWDILKEHCVRLHPQESLEISRLHPAEIHELRRLTGSL